MPARSREFPFTDKSLGTIAEEYRKASFIAQALKATGLDEQMAHLEGYTLFLPTDEAVSRLPENLQAEMKKNPKVLLSILRAQMVKGILPSGDLKELSSITTLGGVTMAVGRRGLKITLAESDLALLDLYGNGFVVHFVTGIIVSGVTIRS